ncbi:MAG: AmmeMemoRadiSam system protein B [bacterium]
MENKVYDKEYPRIRYIEAFPVDTDQGRMIGLRDPSGIATGTILLSPDIFYLLQFFDGNHSTLDLRYEYMRAFGNFLYEDQLSQILLNLDSHLFLDNHNFQGQVIKIEQEFSAQRVRQAVLAGQSYEADPIKLREQIKSFFKSPQGAGLPAHTTGKKEVRGLIAPHIDLRGGGPCYSYAYKVLAESTGADCFVILGTAHAGIENLYSVLPKDFVTPFGQAKCDLEFIQLLESNYQGDSESELFPHKIEHTIEVQLIFLQYLYLSKRDFTFVPVLCSFSYPFLDPGHFPKESKIVKDFSAALKRTISQYDKKVCLIASVDLSHVGPRYGDQNTPDLSFLAKVNQADQELLKYIENLDSEGFHRCIERYEDRYRVCGFAPIYTLLKSMEAKQGKLLKYSKTQVDPHNSTVTFASMVFY